MVYFQFGLNYTIPQDSLERRKLRQQIGENFLEWATAFYHKDRDDDGHIGLFLNRKIEKDFLVEKYLNKFPNDRKYMDSRKLKQKLQLYARYADLDFNPGYKGKRIKSSSLEFIIIANDDFDKSNCPIVREDRDLQSIF